MGATIIDKLPINDPSPALLALDVTIVACLLAAAIWWSRFVYARTRNRAATLVHGAFALYLVGLLAVVFLPLHGIHASSQAFDGTRPLTRAWFWGMQVHSPYGANGVVWQRIANVALTIPFGFGFGLLVPRLGVRRILLWCIAWAVSLELAQLTISVLLRVVYRSFDVNDIIDNTLGASIGLAIFTVLAFVVRDREIGVHKPNTTLLGFLAESVNQYFAAHAARRGWDDPER